MSSQKTEHYELNQWLATDQVLRTDFNADNAKIDAALAARPCQFYTASYVGTGTGNRTITFPKKPMLILIIGYHGCMFTTYGASRMCICGTGENDKTISVIWDGYSISWANSTGNTDGVRSDIANQTYTVFALLDADT